MGKRRKNEGGEAARSGVVRRIGGKRRGERTRE